MKTLLHPVTNAIYTPTEGAYAVADYDGYLAMWSSSLAELGVENRYSIEYNGTNQVKVKINNREWGNLAWSPTASPSVLTIGGLPTASAGNAAGFCWSTIANVLIQDQALSNGGYDDLFSGSYEASTLTTYVVSLTNPGGENNTTGWTSEVGGLSTKSPTGPTAAVQPLPHSGVGYFFAGANAQTIARQRATLTTVTGLSTGDLDTAIANGMWGRIRWWQSSYDNTGGTSTDEDTASMGIRYLNGSATQLSLTYSGLLRMNPRLTWFRRSLPISVPSTARSIDAVYRSDRASGTNNDGYIDDITLHLYAI
ncbi:hypothetical protein OMD46_16325 [Pseudomonas sp. MDMC_285]|nr:hypothetical protein [Pseudomonas sp. MDMC_285]